MIGKFLGFVLIIALLIVGALAAWYVIESRGVAPEILEEKYLTPADQFLNIGAARVRVRIEGQQDAPVIIMNHGFTHSLETWDGWVASLKDDYRIVRYDLAGHGLTGPDPEMRYAPLERATFLGDLMDVLEIERAVVVGNSLGGLVAWRFASTNPDRVDALVLVAPGVFSINGVADEAVPVPLPLRIFLMTAPKSAMREAAERVYGDGSKVTDATVERMRDMIRRRGNGAALVDALNEFTMPDPTKDLQSLATPTLVLWGDEDAIIPVEQGKHMTALMPNAKLIKLPGVGHVAQEEAPDKTSGDVRAFLKMHEAIRIPGGE